MDASEHEHSLRREPHGNGRPSGPHGPRPDGLADRPPRPTPAGGTTPALSPERATRVLEGIGEAIVVLDAEKRVTWWNHAAERATGVRREDVVGRRLLERFSGLKGTLAERVLADVMARREAREFSGWHFRGAGSADGRAAVYDARLSPLEDGGLLLFFTDVTTREAQREELEAQRTELQARLAEIEDLRDFAYSMARIAESTTLLQLLCSAAVQHVGGVSSIVARDVGEGMGECVAAAGVGRPLQGRTFKLAGSVIERVLAGGARVVLERYASDSSFFRAVAREEGIGPLVMLPLVAHGELLGVFGLARAADAAPFSEADLARLDVFANHAALAAWKARLVERAEEANEAKANFLASMSHELRTPLTTLTGYGELLADEDILGPLSTAQHEVVERMRLAAQELSGLIDGLLMYASLEAGREHARMDAVRAAEIVEEAVAAAEPAARHRGLGFEVAPLDALPVVRTDAGKVRHILVNLLGNAIKFTDTGGVRLDFSCPEGELCFHVRDTGIGIAAADLRRLFHPFAQLDGGLTRRHGGTGLGLYLSWRLARMLGGTIRVASTPGQGSCFTLVLPR